MKTKISITFIIFISIIFFACIFPFNNVEGLTQAEAGQAIADFAKNVAQNHASETYYLSPENTHRPQAYKGIKSYSYDGKDLFAFDCNGFVSFTVRHSLGIGGTSFTKFAWPSGTVWTPNSTYFETVPISETSLSAVVAAARPGDLIGSVGDPGNDTHVQIYIGNNQVVDCASKYPNAVKIRGTSSILHSKGKFTLLRVKTSAVAEVTSVNEWIDQIGVVRQGTDYKDQNGDSVIYENGEYRYENEIELGKITQVDGKYYNEAGEEVKIQEHTGSVIVDEETGEVITNLADALDLEKFQGLLRVQRAKSQNDQENDLLYTHLDKLMEKIENDDVSALNYYAINGDALVVAASKTITYLGTNDELISEVTTIEVVNIEYKTLISKFGIPFGFQYALLLSTLNPNFSKSITQLQIDGEIILTLQDYNVKETEVIEIETKIEVIDYNINEDGTTTKTGSHIDTQKSKGTTIIQTVTPVLNLKSADTWFYVVNNKYNCYIKKEGGQPQVTELGNQGTPSNIYNAFDKKYTEYKHISSIQTYTNSKEKTVWTRDPSSEAETKEDIILELFDEVMEAPYSDNAKPFAEILISSREILFNLLDDELTQEHLKIMRYLLYKYTGNDYGVTELDLEAVKGIFNILDTDTEGTGDYFYTGDYTSVVDTSVTDDSNSSYGVQIARFAEYFVKEGNRRNLLMYSTSNRIKRIQVRNGRKQISI